MRKLSGFTIVELIIVIAVIGILAGLSVVGYRGVTEQGKIATVTAGLKDASGKLKLEKFDSRAYPLTGNLASAGIVDKDGVTYEYTSNGSTYCLTASNGNVSYKVSPDTTPSTGGCPGHSSNGVAAITNLASNPSVESNLTGYTGYYSPPLTRDSNMADSGTYSIVATTNSTTNPQGIIIPVTTSAQPNTQYRCSVALAGTANTMVTLSGRPATSADGYITEGIGANSINLGATFYRYVTTFTTPANTGILRIQVRINTPTSGRVIRADSVMCTTGPNNYNYADGSSANWIWNGAVNNSSSSGQPI